MQQSGAPDPTVPTSSTQELDQPSTSTAHQRPSSPSPSSPGADSINAPSSSTGRQTSYHPQRQSGSASTMADINRSSTPPESAEGIKYTRTGRVSKAAKGSRVHRCEECGKVYTRAEHLRRHQQNHKPGAFPCDHPGCGRSFYREDLLVRHKMRHSDPLDSPSRRQSIESQTSSPDPRSFASRSTQPPGLPLPSTATSELVGRELQPRTSDTTTQQADVSTRPPKRVPIPPNELIAGVSIPVEGLVGLGAFANPWDLSSPSSPLGYGNEYEYESADEAVGLPYYQAQSLRLRNLSVNSYTGYGQPYSTSRSPASAGSSSVHLAQWPYPTSSHASFSDSSYLQGYEYTDPNSISTLPFSDPRALTAETRDIMEQHDLAVLGLVQSQLSLGDGTSIPDEQRYLDAYWESVHELYPLLFKPKSEYGGISPLLHAAILALGGQVSGDRNDLLNARTLHERCLKVLKKRTTQRTHTYRVCDMQAIVLIEVYSIFKSRRPPLQLSGNFENVYRILASDASAMMPGPVDTPMDTGRIGDDGNVDTMCKQRLLLTCFILEQQHAMLFGRLPTNGLSELRQDLPFPTSQTNWDAGSGWDSEAFGDLTFYERVSDARRAIKDMPRSAIQPHDAFRSMVLLADTCDTPDGLVDGMDVVHERPLELAIEQSPRAEMVYHTLMLCKNTQIRDLLAVAGESWVMAEKLSTQAEYTAAQIELREWASSTFTDFELGDTVQRALSHAFRILAIHQEHPRTGVLFQEWAVYLAALVIWARVYVSISESSASRKRSNHLDQTAEDLIRTASTSMMDWHGAKTILSWATAKIEKYDVPHTCGLTSGALDVLRKLEKRGDEVGWF